MPILLLKIKEIEETKDEVSVVTAIQEEMEQTEDVTEVEVVVDGTIIDQCVKSVENQDT